MLAQVQFSQLKTRVPMILRPACCASASELAGNTLRNASAMSPYSAAARRLCSASVGIGGWVEPSSAVAPVKQRHVVLRAARERLEHAFLQQMAVDDRPRGRAVDAARIVGIVELDQFVVRRARELDFARRPGAQLVDVAGAERASKLQAGFFRGVEPRQDAGEERAAALADGALEEALGQRRSHQRVDGRGAGRLAEDRDAVRDRRRTPRCWP